MFDYLLSYLLHSTILISIILLINYLKLVKSQYLLDSLLKLALIGAFFSAGLVQIQGDNSFNLSNLAFKQAKFIFLTSQLTQARANLTANNQDFKQVSANSPATKSAANLPTATPNSIVAELKSNISFDLFALSKLALAIYLIALAFFLFRIIRAWLELSSILKNKNSLANSKLELILENLKSKAQYFQPIKLSYASNLNSPIALINNEICLPEKSLELSAQEQEIMLAHELAHIIRNDPYWLLLSTFIKTVFFFQPLNFINSKALVDSAEYICDDFAIEQTQNNIVLAQCLALVAQWQLRPQNLNLVNNIAASSLGPRIKKVLSGNRLEPSSKIKKLALNSLILLLVILTIPKVSIFAQSSKPDIQSLASIQSSDIKQIWIATVAIHNAKFSQNYQELISLPKGSVMIIEELVNSNSRKVSLVGTDSGIEINYFENGTSKAVDEDIEYWYKTILKNYTKPYYNLHFQRQENPYEKYLYPYNIVNNSNPYKRNYGFKPYCSETAGVKTPLIYFYSNFNSLPPLDKRLPLLAKDNLISEIFSAALYSYDQDKLKFAIQASFDPDNHDFFVTKYLGIKVIHSNAIRKFSASKQNLLAKEALELSLQALGKN